MKRKIKRWTPFFLLWIPFKLFSLFNRRNADFFLFGTGTGMYHDNSKYMLEYMQRTTLGKKCYWITADEKVYNFLRSAKIQCIKKNTLKAAWLSSQAKAYFITAELYDVFYFINDKTKLIQLWHGTPIKRIGFDAGVDTRAIGIKKMMGRNYTYDRFDFILAEDAAYVAILRDAFKVSDKQLHVVEQPRNSIFYKPDRQIIIKNVKEKIGISNFVKTVLYAPTFRDTIQDNTILLEKVFTGTLEKWLTSSNTVLLLRLHPLLYKKLTDDPILKRIQSVANIVDVSSYNDVQELMLISDVLVSDYSSMFFDWSHTGRPAYSFLPDLEKCVITRGGFYPLTLSRMREISKTINAIENLSFDIATEKAFIDFEHEFKKITSFLCEE